MLSAECTQDCLDITLKFRLLRVRGGSIPGLDQLISRLNELLYFFGLFDRVALSPRPFSPPVEKDLLRAKHRAIDRVNQLFEVLQGVRPQLSEVSELSEDDIFTDRPSILGLWPKTQIWNDNVVKEIPKLMQQLGEIKAVFELIEVFQAVCDGKVSPKELGIFASRAMSPRNESLSQDKGHNDDSRRQELLSSLAFWREYVVIEMSDGVKKVSRIIDRTSRPKKQNIAAELQSLPYSTQQLIQSWVKLEETNHFSASITEISHPDEPDDLLCFASEFYPSPDLSTNTLEQLYQEYNSDPVKPPNEPPYAIRILKPRRTPLLSLTYPYGGAIVDRWCSGDTTKKIQLDQSMAPSASLFEETTQPTSNKGGAPTVCIDGTGRPLSGARS